MIAARPSALTLTCAPTFHACSSAGQHPGEHAMPTSLSTEAQSTEIMRTRPLLKCLVAGKEFWQRRSETVVSPRVGAGRCYPSARSARNAGRSCASARRRTMSTRSWTAK